MDAVRSYGSGSFKKRKTANGQRWQGYVYASDAKKCYGTGATQREAERVANNARDKHERALREAVAMTPATPLVPTLTDWLSEYNAHRARQRRADSTIGKYRDYAGLWIDADPMDGKGPLGARRVSEIDIRVLEVAIADFHKRYSRNTVRNLQAYVSGALKRAYLVRHCDRNEAALLDPIRRKTKGSLSLHDDHFVALCHAAKNDASMLSAIVLGRYGLRISETCGVTSDDVTGNVLTLSRQLDRVVTSGPYGPAGRATPKGVRKAKGGTTLALTKLKSEAAARAIRLTDVEVRVLMRALDTAKPDTLWDSVESRWRTGVLFVCHAPTGRAQEAQRLRDRYTALCDRLHVPRHYHDLRALFATALADEGHALKAISAAIGHTSAQITEMYIRGLRTSTGAVWDATSDAVGSVLESLNK